MTTWTVRTDRMTVSLVSEADSGDANQPRMPRDSRMPPPVRRHAPAYLLVARPGEAEPVRIEAEDAELLMWMLMRLGTRRQMTQAFAAPMMGDTW